MTDSRTAIEGDSLEDTLQKASEALGVPLNELDYELDREHFKNGATTVRIFAAQRSPENQNIREKVEKFLVSELGSRNLEAEVRAKVTNGSVEVVLSAAPGVIQDDDESMNALSEIIREVIGDLGDRTLDIRLVVVDPEPPRDRDRGRGRDRDRGDRGDRRGGRGRDRDRGDRGGDRRGRGGRGAERGERRGRGRPEKDPERDNELKDRAKAAIKDVLKTGDAVDLDNLNSYERRIVHRTVAAVKGVTTKSLGDGSLKTVQILVGSDEETDAAED